MTHHLRAPEALPRWLGASDAARYLGELIDYNPETGDLTWRLREPHWFKNSEHRTAERECRRWNTRHANTTALSTDKQGYRRGWILGKMWAGHIVAFTIYHGRLPVGQIDHINGDRSDNRIGNLREVTPTENARNATRRCDNTSGTTGVGFHKGRRKWVAYISVGGQQRHLGLFRTKPEALAARRHALRMAGYHENHGKR